MRPHLLRASPGRHAGVTLIELAVTIALVGIVAVMMVQFIAPVRSYIDTSRRAALADTADTALRRIGRDLRLALPNSVRVSGNYVEFLLVRTGGRYQAELGTPTAGTTCDNGTSSTPANDVLLFGANDSCLASIGNIPNVADITDTGVTKGDFLVVFNLPSGAGAVTGANAYDPIAVGSNRVKISDKYPGTHQDRIKFDTHTFTYESPGNRFFVVEGPVSYGCAGGTLTRYWDYVITSTQNAPPTGAKSAVIATGVAECSFTYDTSIAAQGAGLVTMKLQLSMQDSRGSTETITLHHAVHVNNVP